MTTYTFDLQYAAGLAGDMSDRYVFIPDQVAREQSAYDGRSFPVLRRDGAKMRAVLRGDLYGLGTGGVGDPVISLR